MNLGGRRRVKGLATFALLLAAALALAPQAPAAERSVRVGPDYFGVNYPLMTFDPPEVRDRQLTSIAGAGVGSVRAALSWAALEPDAPTNGVHTYDWTASDQRVTELAMHGLRLMPAFLYTPKWAVRFPLSCNGTNSVSASTARLGDYAAAAGALAERYGAGGSFWKQHPELPATPILTWQIWNEPNLRSFWCPGPDPAAYAELFVQAAQAIKKADPAAQVITSGLVLIDEPGRYMEGSEFLTKMTAAQPGLWKLADGNGVHVFPSGEIADQFRRVVTLRSEMTAAGVPQSVPMFASEFGWGLAGFQLTEAQRAERYAYVTERAPSTNCNVGMMFAHAWTTSPSGGPVFDSDSGIADRLTGALFPSATAFRDTVAVLEGRSESEAIHPRLRNCPGMPKLDRDADGRAEYRDYYPLDPSRFKGPPGWDRTLVVSTQKRQRLGKAVSVTVNVEQPLEVAAKGKVKLAGERGKLKLKAVKAAVKVGKEKRLKLRLSAKARKRIHRSGARRGNATILITGVDDEGDVFEEPAKVKLRAK